MDYSKNSKNYQKKKKKKKKRTTLFLLYQNCKKKMWISFVQTITGAQSYVSTFHELSFLFHLIEESSLNRCIKNFGWTHQVVMIHVQSNPGGATRMARGGIRLVHGHTKSTLITYFSGMKIDPNYAFLHAFFLICPSCPFQNLSIWPKTHPFFQFCTFLHP